jgi:hypothetical protein
MRRLPGSLAALVSLVVIGTLTMLAPGKTLGLTQYTTYGGADAAGDNVVINYSAQTHKTDLYFYKIPLNPTNCPGQTMDLILPAVTVTLGSFDQYDAVQGQGANGVYATDTSGYPVVRGTIYVAQGQSCANSISYLAGTHVALQGDYNCIWLKLYNNLPQSAESVQPQGTAPSLLDAITVQDVIDFLRHLLGLPNTDVPQDCPALGTATPSGTLQGDADCDSQINPKDALVVLQELIGLDVPVSGPHCVKVGKFFLLDQ